MELLSLIPVLFKIGVPITKSLTLETRFIYIAKTDIKKLKKDKWFSLQKKSILLNNSLSKLKASRLALYAREVFTLFSILGIVAISGMEENTLFQ